MTSEKSSIKKPLARLLFLGNPMTDRRVKNFLTLLVSLGYEVEFIFAAPGEWEIGLTIEGVRINQLMLEYSGGPRMFMQYAKLLRNQLQDSAPCDVLFACELYSLGAAANTKLNHRTKQLFYDARELYTELPTVINNELKKWFWKRQERIGLQQTDLVIVTAPDDAAAIKEVHHFLPPSILVRNLPKREPYEPNNYLREYFHIPPEKKVFVYIGGLQGDRGLEKMMTLMSLLGDQAVFIMIGDGALKDKLQEQWRTSGLENIVFFHPPIESESVIKILSSADIGVSLIEANSKSYELALPSKIFEYMLAGLPVLSSSLKQVKDLFDKTEGIVFTDPDNQGELLKACKKVIELSADSKLRYSIHELLYKNFTFETDSENLKSYLTRHPTPETRYPLQ